MNLLERKIMTEETERKVTISIIELVESNGMTEGNLRVVVERAIDYLRNNSMLKKKA